MSRMDGADDFVGSVVVVSWVSYRYLPKVCQVWSGRYGGR